ncbi:molybdate ABC transporter substrate-binding protein [Acidithiobacillus ferrianus]|uniref:Molybdate ABC transporter substrate-binding protein n=2 Tax=Acidithiobacillus ferrianus TaxID=2678518 RepID=A0ACD5HDW2_9PROT|nr:molybdate ABC transporter substrate-binding protein [Acidithiobacillus ferrianus]
MMLSTSHLAYAHGHRMVLEDVSLQLNAGESVALLGANGSGKSTLIRLLLGILKPLRGEIRLGDTDLHALSAKERAQRLAYVPQDHGAVFPFLVRDVVLMGRMPHQSWLGAASAHDREQAEAALARLGISSLAERSYMELSGGQRQLVIIARALAQETPILILDEPVTGLDYGNQHRLMAQIQDLADSGYAILQSSHYPEHALSTANRVILLKDGRVLADGPPAEVLHPERLRALYGIDTECLEISDGRRVILPKVLASAVSPSRRGACLNLSSEEYPMTHTLHIFASLTLAEPFQEIIQGFTSAHPDVSVKPTYGFCGALMEQMAAGAPADVFAPSSEPMLAKAAGQGFVQTDTAVNYARNRLVLVSLMRDYPVAPKLEDLMEERYARIAVGDPESVPPGRYARMALEKAGLWQDLEARLQKYPDGLRPLQAVLEGRADAVFIFASTANSVSGKAHVVDIPVGVSMHYPVAVTTKGAEPELARAFVAYLQTDSAQKILELAGFAPVVNRQPLLNAF